MTKKWLKQFQELFRGSREAFGIGTKEALNVFRRVTTPPEAAHNVQTSLERLSKDKDTKEKGT